MKNNKILYSWEDIELKVSHIVHIIKQKNLILDYICGIPRGGLIIAVLISHMLNKPFTISPHSIKPGNILLVDDISDTGTTFINNVHYLRVVSKHKIITASIHIKPETKFVPDIYCEETSEWIKYPWETLETSKADYKEAQTQLDKDMNKVFSKENMAKAAKLR